MGRLLGQMTVNTTAVKTTQTSSAPLLPIAVVGLLAGFLAGLFGVGGGILIVPGLVLAAHMTQRLAHGTSLAAVVPISVASLITYAAHDNVDWNVALWLASRRYALPDSALGARK